MTASSWKKYPQPVITAETQDNYGVGQPDACYNNQGGTIRMFYEDNSYGLHHVEATSSDGVHFDKLGTLTANGLDPNSLGWGDMAYDPDTGYWYAGFNRPNLALPLLQEGWRKSVPTASPCIGSRMQPF